MNETMTMEKNEQGVWEIKLPTDNVAKLEQRGVFGGIEGFEIAGIPVGSALLGGTTALLVSEVIDGFIKPNGFTGQLIKLLAAAGLVQFMPRFMGTTTTRFASAFIAFDAVKGLIPLDQWIKNITGRISGARLAQTMTGGAVGGNGHREVTSIAEYNAIRGIS